MESHETQTRVLVFLAYAGVVLLLLLWAMFIRKQKAKKRRVYKNQPHTWQLDPAAEKQLRRRRRHERKRRTLHPERPINPTLAQSGGLPPRRPEDVPPPGA
jgi:hypothetical protein